MNPVHHHGATGCTVTAWRTTWYRKYFATCLEQSAQFCFCITYKTIYESNSIWKQFPCLYVGFPVNEFKVFVAGAFLCLFGYSCCVSDDFLSEILPDARWIYRWWMSGNTVDKICSHMQPAQKHFKITRPQLQITPVILKKSMLQPPLYMKYHSNVEIYICLF